MLAKLAFGLILLAPTASAAEPKSEDVPRVRLVDRRPPTRADARKPGEWIELADATPAKHGSEHISLDPKLGPLAQLRIEAKGTVILRSVKIYFEDRSQKILRVDTMLSQKRPATTLDVKRDVAIDRIVVETAPQTRGTYTVQGIGVQPSASMAKR